MTTNPLPSPTDPRRIAAIITAAALAVGALIAPAAAASADVVVPTPSAHYDMTHSGTSLTDVSGNGRNATLTALPDSSFLDLAGGDVLRFQNNGYASLPKNLVTATDNDFSVEMTVSARTAAATMGWVIGDGVGNWNTAALGNHIFMTPYSNQGGYSNAILSAIRVYTGSANGESRLPAGGAVDSGFTTITMTSTGNTLKLFKNGTQISTLTHAQSLSSIIPAGNVLGYLGRSLYNGDALLTADVSDVKFWDVSLTADEVAASQPTTAAKAALSSDMLRVDALRALLATNVSASAVTANLAFPAAVNGTALTWNSSNPAAVSATGVVTRATTDTAVTITATSSTTVYTYEITIKAKSDTEIAAAVQADLDAVVLKARTTENLPLATTGRLNSSAITWTSSDSSIVTPTAPDYAAPAVGAADPFKGAGLITRSGYGQGDKTVTLTATAAIGAISKQKTFTITVAEKTRTAPDAGYAAAYFKADNDERIYQAATTGNDFFTFTPVNGGAATISSTADTKGLRDPYILRSHDGDKYYMIATDLCIGTTSAPNNCSQDWGSAQSNGSLKVEVWESTDLVHWTRTNGANTGITINQPAAGMTWAPEAYWDDSLQSYVVFFSSRLYDDASHSSGPGYARLFYVLTRDFTSFTYPPVLWQDTGKARIDSTVTKIGEYYYRFSKNEESNGADGLEAGKDIFLERSKILTSVTTASSSATNANTGWQLVDTNMTTKETGAAGEGPEIIKLNAGDPNNTTGDGYVFLVDNYSAGGYTPFVTTATAIAASTMSNRLSNTAAWTPRAKTGMPASPRHGAFVSVPKAVLTAVRGWTNVAAVSSTTTASLAGRTASATVVAADSGSVAGSVTFTAGSWSASSRVVGGVASVDLPDSVAGTVTVAYDGYTDGLVSASTTTLSVPFGTLTAATPVISGTAKVGSVLTADPGAWSPAGVGFTYQWLRNGSAIAGATGSSYALVTDDASATIAVTVTGSKPGFTTATATSAATAAVAAGDFSATPAPTLAGTAKVGGVLTATVGPWAPAATVSLQWLRDGAPIAGAVGASYTVVAGDRGHRISVRATGSATGYAAASVDSIATAPVAAGTLTGATPKITGSVKVGKKLTAKAGTWKPSGVTVTYKWYRSGKAIKGATKATYTLKAADKGKTITVKVTGKKTGYTTLVKTSKKTKKVAK